MQNKIYYHVHFNTFDADIQKMAKMPFFALSKAKNVYNASRCIWQTIHLLKAFNEIFMVVTLKN